MQVVRFDDAPGFLARAQGFLLRDEAANNLILGIAGRLCHDIVPGTGGPEAYLATVEEDGASVSAAALMTPPHALVLSQVVDAVLPAATIALAADLSSTMRTLPGAGGPVSVSRAFAESWAAVSGQATRRGMGLRIFQLELVHHVAGVPGHLRRAATNDIDLARRWLRAFDKEIDDETADAVAGRVDTLLRTPEPEGLHIWEVDGQSCSMAAAVGPTLHGIRINSVYTPPPLRGHGYASACVAALSQRQLDAGRRFCFLYTDVSNPTSNHIYQQIGYRPICDVDDYRFA